MVRSFAVRRCVRRCVRSYAAALVVLVVLVGSLACTTAATAATTVNYDESIDGDLPGIGTLTVFNFGSGVNTISGTTTAGSSPDFDSFAFVIPAGHQLTTGGVAIVDASGNLLAAAWDLRSGGLTWNSGSFVEGLVVNSPGVDALTNVPQGPGNYNVSAASFTASSDNDSSNYTFTFTVIPEPASLSLLGFGSLALLARRRVRN
jgi:hypothetical protein